MNETTTRPLYIAFMAHTFGLAQKHLRTFAEDNEEQVKAYSRERLTLIDGTTIKAISPYLVRSRLDGHRFDQLILADDEREMIRADFAEEVLIFRSCHMILSCVPEEFQVLYYNPFSPEPCRECGRPSEVLHHRRGADTGLVSLCRECHERAHAGDYITQGLADGLATVGKAAVSVSINSDKLAEAFCRMAEAASGTLSMIEEIESIRTNPSLSRFQKWRLIRKVKRRRP